MPPHRGVARGRRGAIVRLAVMGGGGSVHEITLAATGASQHALP
jgi:hypothetical protein